MRLLACWRTFKRFWVDDILVIFAWLLTLGSAIDWQIIARKMYQAVAIAEAQLRPLPPTFATDAESLLRGTLVVDLFYPCSLWAIKMSFLLFFRRLGHNVTGQNFLWWSVLGFTVASYLVCIRIIQYSCFVTPFSQVWRECETKEDAYLGQASLKIICALDVFTDFSSSISIRI